MGGREIRGHQTLSGLLYRRHVVNQNVAAVQHTVKPHAADLGTEILYDEGKLVHAMAYRAGAHRERTPLMHDIRRDGIDL